MLSNQQLQSKRQSSAQYQTYFLVNSLLVLSLTARVCSSPWQNGTNWPIMGWRAVKHLLINQAASQSVSQSVNQSINQLLVDLLKFRSPSFSIGSSTIVCSYSIFFFCDVFVTFRAFEQNYGVHCTIYHYHHIILSNLIKACVDYLLTFLLRQWVFNMLWLHFVLLCIIYFLSQVLLSLDHGVALMNSIESSWLHCQWLLSRLPSFWRARKNAAVSSLSLTETLSTWTPSLVYF